jgi:hypothetical protein
VFPLGPMTGVLQGTNLVMVEVSVTGPVGRAVEVGGGVGLLDTVWLWPGLPQPSLHDVTVMVLVVQVVLYCTEEPLCLVMVMGQVVTVV